MSRAPRTLAYAALCLVPFATIPLGAATAATTPQVVARTVAAWADVRDANGQTWTARAGLVGGSSTANELIGADIAGTTDDAPYRVSTFSSTGYTRAVTAGRYRVRLLMAEGYYSRAGQRVFDVTAEGATMLSRVDIVAAAGRGAAYERSFEVDVTDGRLDVGFVKVVDNPLIAGIEVVFIGPAAGTTTAPPTTTTTVPSTTTNSATTAPPTTAAARVVARAVASYTDVTDRAGVVWKAREGFVGDYLDARLTGIDIAGTSDDVLYRVQTFGTTRYNRALPSGRYRVRLLMAEDYYTTAGGRVFDVRAQGTVVLSGVDIAGAVGRAAAYERSFEVDVTNGTLTLDFVKVVDRPQFGAVEVSYVGAPGAGSPTTTTTTTPPATTTTTAPPASTTTTPPATTTTTAPPTTTTTTATVPPAGGGTAPVPVAATAPWVTRVESAPLDPNSAQMVANLSADVANNWGGIAAFNNTHYNAAFYRVPAGQPRVDVDFVDCQNKQWVDPNLFTGPAYFKGVPIPDDAQAANGTDAELSIHDPASDQLWEFWQARRNASTGRWEACWGGRIDQVSASMGIFPLWYGATGTGVAMSAGMISLDEVRRGSIEHAMYLGVMNAQAYPSLSWPALRTDGNLTDPNVVREGQRLRLDPSLDLSQFDLTPVGRMIAVAAQRYGFVVSDRSGAVSVVTESGQPEQARTGVDPWPALLGPWEPYEVLRNFPWQSVQVVQADWGKPAQ